LSTLRDLRTERDAFTKALDQVSALLATYATASSHLSEGNIRTPLEETAGHELTHPPCLVPILRAGLGMVPAFERLIPGCTIRHLGMERNEDTHAPRAYYEKPPKDQPPKRGFVLDPMLATGGSACAAIEQVKRWGIQEISFIGVLGCPEGLEKLESTHPDVEIFLGCLDRELDARSYILPGLGDAGDRQFGTD